MASEAAGGAGIGAGAAAPLPAVAAAAAWRSPIGCTAPGADPSAFRAWCASERILWPKCAVGQSPVTGRCVVATQDIAEGEVVVEVRCAFVQLASVLV